MYIVYGMYTMHIVYGIYTIISIYPCVYPIVHAFLYCIYPSVCLSLQPSIHPSVCLSICSCMCALFVYFVWILYWYLGIILRCLPMHVCFVSMLCMYTVYIQVLHFIYIMCICIMYVYYVWYVYFDIHLSICSSICLSFHVYFGSILCMNVRYVCIFVLWIDTLYIMYL